MKKILVLMLAMAMLLPLMGLAEAPAAPEATAEVEAAPETTQPVQGRGQQMRRRWQETEAPGFVDENEDGLCDHCGAKAGEQGSNFLDENKDGVCDHRETAEGGPQGRMQRGKPMQGRGRMQGAGCRGRFMQGRGQAGRPMGQGRNRR